MGWHTVCRLLQWEHALTKSEVQQPGQSMHCKTGINCRDRPKNARLTHEKGRRGSPDRWACLWCVVRHNQSTHCQNLRYDSQVRACIAKQASAVDTDPKTPDCSAKKVGKAHLI
eukprot:1803495-Rhodomonas_salina.2